MSKRIESLIAMNLKLTAAVKQSDLMLAAAQAAGFDPTSVLALESANAALRQLTREAIALRDEVP